MADNFEGLLSGLDSPAEDLFLITPNDTADLAVSTRAISFATVGTLKITTLKGTIIVIPSGTLAPGIFHPIRAKRVHSTGTTVTGIIGGV